MIANKPIAAKGTICFWVKTGAEDFAFVTGVDLLFEDLLFKSCPHFVQKDASALFSCLQLEQVWVLTSKFVPQ